MSCIPLSPNEFLVFNLSLAGLFLSLGAILGVLMQRRIENR